MAATTPKNKMQYVRLGNSGLKVSRIILGTLQYGSKQWADWVLDEEAAMEQIKYAYDAGIQTFDTADCYSNGVTETILGNVIRRLGLPRDELVIMTKLWAPVPDDITYNIMAPHSSPEAVGVVNQKGLSRKHIFDGVKASLKRLQVGYIDLLQCHRFDPDTPIEETMQALHDVVKAGYVRYIGMSSCHAYQFHAMQNYAVNNKLTPFIWMQNHYNLVYREEEREMFPTLKLFGVGAIPWSPLARGLLTRSFGQASDTSRGQSDWMVHGYVGAGTPEIVNRVEELAKKKGITMGQVAIAWSLSKEGVTAPIVGTTRLKNLQEALDALDVQLSEEEVRYLEEPYKLTGVYGHF